MGKRRDRGRGETGEEERQGKRRDRGRGETGEEERQGKRRDRGKPCLYRWLEEM